MRCQSEMTVRKGLFALNRLAHRPDHRLSRLALLPKCPLAGLFYAAIAGSLGLGLLIDTAYLLPLTVLGLPLALSLTTNSRSAQEGTRDIMTLPELRRRYLSF